MAKYNLSAYVMETPDYDELIYRMANESVRGSNYVMTLKITIYSFHPLPRKALLPDHPWGGISFLTSTCPLKV